MQAEKSWECYELYKEPYQMLRNMLDDQRLAQRVLGRKAH